MPTTAEEPKAKKPRTPTAKAPPAAKAPAKPEAAKPAASKVNHVLTLDKDEKALIPAWKVSRPDGSLLGSFSTEASINEKLEKAGDSRRIKHGKIIEL